MIVNIHPSLFEKFPKAKIGVLIAKGLDNQQNPKTLPLLRAIEAKIQQELPLDELNKLPKILDWREAYRAFGFSPSSFRPSVEALLRRVLQNKPLPSVNPVVDLYNYISLKYMLPLGASDLDRIEGSIDLCLADGTERFVQLGSQTPDPIKRGEVVYKDANDVLCRAWNYRESEKSKVTQTSQNICLVIEGLEHTSLKEIEKAVLELKELISQSCGGEFESYVLHKPPLPDYLETEEFKNRCKKLQEIRDLNIDPYPHLFKPSHSAGSLQTQFLQNPVGTSEQAAEALTPEVCLAGRIMLFRPMGKNAFAQIQDQSGSIQIMFNRELTHVEGIEEHALKFIEKKYDLGDIIGVQGHLFRTQVGELTLFVKQTTLLSKALLPLPDKHSGLTNKGMRYRKRWLDLISSPSVKKVFETRSKILRVIRTFLEDKGFLEVETPILQNTYGGAEARPFVTHINALDQEMFLRISLEISLKKLIIGGMERIFEMSKVFRNEGIDRTHNPEFTMLELYAAYTDYQDMMELQETLFEKIALTLFGSTQFVYAVEGQEIMIDVKAPWKRLTMKESIHHYAHLDVDKMSEEEMRLHLKMHTKLTDIEEMPRGLLIASLFAELVEKHLIQPHFIIDHPIETTPLCKPHRDRAKKKEGLIERFESFILGHEYSNAYSELNDPLLQRTLLQEQAAKRQKGNEEAHPMDEEFIEALCQGMAPTGGLGIGIDRLVVLFTHAYSLRDVLYFPIMKPEESS